MCCTVRVSDISPPPYSRVMRSRAVLGPHHNYGCAVKHHEDKTHDGALPGIQTCHGQDCIDGACVHKEAHEL